VQCEHADTLFVQSNNRTTLHSDVLCSSWFYMEGAATVGNNETAVRRRSVKWWRR